MGEFNAKNSSCFSGQSTNESGELLMNVAAANWFAQVTEGNCRDEGDPGAVKFYSTFLKKNFMYVLSSSNLSLCCLLWLILAQQSCIFT